MKAAKTMHVERLHHMIEVLRRVERPLDLREWACGSVCCAVSYAGLDPEFQAQGFKLALGDDDDDDPVFPSSVAELNQLVSGHPRRDGYPVFLDGADAADGVGVCCSGWDAVAAFFGITYRQAFWLFAKIAYEPRQRGNPAAVIECIKYLIGRGGALPARIS